MSDTAALPDYRERLAYGTDQGRWLMEQTSSETNAKRRPQRPQRAFHTECAAASAMSCSESHTGAEARSSSAGSVSTRTDAP